jgi:hypothetical protein
MEERSGPVAFRPSSPHYCGGVLITRTVNSTPGSPEGMSHTTTFGLSVAFWKSKTISPSTRIVKPKRIETELLGCPFTVMTLLEPGLSTTVSVLPPQMTSKRPVKCCVGSAPA